MARAVLVVLENDCGRDTFVGFIFCEKLYFSFGIRQLYNESVFKYLQRSRSYILSENEGMFTYKVSGSTTALSRSTSVCLFELYSLLGFPSSRT